jgi:hypothetical protein
MMWRTACAALLLGVVGACTTVGPQGAGEHWRVVTSPGGGLVTTSFGATCRTPCNVRIPDAPFEISVAKDGFVTWSAHYDPARPNELSVLARQHDRLTDAAGGAALAGAGMAAAGGGLATAELMGGAAVIGGLPWLLAPPVRRLEVTLQANEAAAAF